MKSDAGLSLLEVIVALGLLSLLMVAILPVISGSAATSVRTSQKIEQFETERSARSALTRMLAATPWMPDEMKAYRFEGTSQSLSFVTTSLEVPKRVRLSLAPGFETRPIVISLSNINSSNSDLIEEDWLNDVSAIAIKYWGQNSAAASSQWRDNWDANRPPALVRIDIWLKNSAQTPDLTMEFATTAEVPMLCEFDPVSQRCRGS